MTLHPYFITIFKMKAQDFYLQQLQYIFDREVSEPPWYRHPEEEDPFEEDPLKTFEFIENLCQQPKIDLAAYSNAQVGIGLIFIFDSAVSNLAYNFKGANVPIKRREQALHNLFNLFSDIFNERCEAISSAFSNEHSTKIQYICYMFWDVCALSTWMDFTGINTKDIVAEVQRRYANIENETGIYYKAIASVMQRCLGLSNPACVESGLHGLGHLATFLPEIAVPIIDRFLAAQKDKHSPLANYAQLARTGMIL